MGTDDVIDLATERDRRIHDFRERRLQEVRRAFERALPLPAGKSSSRKGKQKKGRKPSDS